MLLVYSNPDKTSKFITERVRGIFLDEKASITYNENLLSYEKLREQSSATPFDTDTDQDYLHEQARN